jgi:hypothetical protein
MILFFTKPIKQIKTKTRTDKKKLIYTCLPAWLCQLLDHLYLFACMTLPATGSYLPVCLHDSASNWIIFTYLPAWLFQLLDYLYLFACMTLPATGSSLILNALTQLFLWPFQSSFWWSLPRINKDRETSKKKGKSNAKKSKELMQNIKQEILRVITLPLHY